MKTQNSFNLDPAKKDFYIAESEKYITDCQQKIEEINKQFIEGNYEDAESLCDLLKESIRDMKARIGSCAQCEDFISFKVGCTYVNYDFTDGSMKTHFFKVISRTQTTITVTSSYYDRIPDGKIHPAYSKIWDQWEYDDTLGQAIVTLNVRNRTTSEDTRKIWGSPRAFETARIFFTGGEYISAHEDADYEQRRRQKNSLNDNQENTK